MCFFAGSKPVCELLYSPEARSGSACTASCCSGNTRVALEIIVSFDVVAVCAVDSRGIGPSSAQRRRHPPACSPRSIRASYSKRVACEVPWLLPSTPVGGAWLHPRLYLESSPALGLAGELQLSPAVALAGPGARHRHGSVRYH